MTIRRKNQRGQATIESALSLLVFLPVLFGIIEFGHLIYTYNYVHYMARDATRYASVRGSTSASPATSASIETYVRNQAVAMVPSDIAVATAFANDSNAPGSSVTVTVSYPFPGLIGWVMPSAPTVVSRSQMKILQ